ncbi:MAG: MFS transporter, partial [Actinomycetia bacterium]|nr:MFS transporter [Actinomycetes bacterium]
VWVLFVPAVASGLTGGSATAMVRARWNHALPEPQQLHTAYSLESTLDELTFIVGPVAAAWLATAVHPSAGLVVPGILGLVGAFVFYQVLVASQPPVRARTKRAPGEARHRQTFILAIGGVALVVAVTVFVGMTFGSIDVSAVAATTAWGARDRSGLVLAAMSAGSAIAGLAYGLRTWVWPLRKRFTSGMVIFACLLVLLLLAHSVPVLAVCGFVAGFAVAPTLINANSLMGTLVPVERLTEGLSWVGTALGFGVSIGSSVAGRLIDLSGYRAGYLTVLVCAAAGAVLVLAGTRTLRAHSSG